jgi:hypothetical protein
MLRESGRMSLLRNSGLRFGRALHEGHLLRERSGSAVLGGRRVRAASTLHGGRLLCEQHRLAVLHDRRLRPGLFVRERHVQLRSLLLAGLVACSADPTPSPRNVPPSLSSSDHDSRLAVPVPVPVPVPDPISPPPTRPRPDASTTAPAPAPAPAPNDPAPIVKLTTIGMHVGGGPYDEPTKEPMKKSVEPRFTELARCWKLVAKPRASDFGVDLLIEAKGGRARVTNPRSSITDEGFVPCVVRFFEEIDFLPPKNGRTVVSYSVRFTP